MNTNIDKIKRIMKEFVELKPKLLADNKSVFHPFLMLRMYVNEKGELVDIFEKEENFENFKEKMCRLIDSRGDLFSLLNFVTKPYKMTIFYYICNELSDKDYGESIIDCWTMEEFTSRNPNVSEEEMVDLFKNAKKEYMMNKEELKIFNSLPNQVTIYRGVYNREGLEELSWTLDYEIAEWFATRYESKEHIIFEVTLPKEEIITYINCRNEQEVIIDPYNLWKYEVKEIIL